MNNETVAVASAVGEGAQVKRIGVVIPAYKSEQWLERTALSVLRQRSVDLEVLIVDDGSPDDSAGVAARLAEQDRRLSLLRKSNGGPASARNSGCHALSASVDAVMFLDADDELEPDALLRLTNALGSQPSSPVVYGLPRYVDRAGKLIRYGEAERYCLGRLHADNGKLVECDPDEPTTFKMLAVSNWVISPGQALLRRSAFDQIGGFNPSLVGPDDWDLWLRLSLIAPLTFLHHPILRYRLHDAQLSRDITGMNRSIDRLLQTLVGLIGPEEARQFKEARRLAHGPAAQLRWRWTGRSLLEGHPIDAAKQARHALLEWWLLHRPSAEADGVKST